MVTRGLGGFRIAEAWTPWGAQKGAKRMNNNWGAKANKDFNNLDFFILSIPINE
jgi:hypothetical protein